MTDRLFILNSVCCDVCHCTLNQPQLFLCGHSYCFGCLENLNETCLKCGHRFRRVSIYDVTLGGIIETLKSGAIHKKDLEDHVKCPVCFVPELAVTFNCGHSVCCECCFHLKHTHGYCPITTDWRQVNTHWLPTYDCLLPVHISSRLASRTSKSAACSRDANRVSS